MPHASRYPCPYCHWVKGAIAPSSEMRTFEGIIQHNQEWKEAGGQPARLKFHFNCRNEPLAFFPREGLVINYVPLSELHLLLGLVNKMFSELLVIFPEAIQWPQKLHLVKEEYHHQFEGNECHTLICRTDILFDILQNTTVTENNPAICFAKAFKLLGQMVQTCFGRDLKDGWKENIQNFCDAYLLLKISITSKFHIIKDHLTAFCQHHGCGLARFSEQSFEAVHADFAKFWERHQVKDKSNKLYSQRLRQTVLEYNSAHI
jgi:hypothetical protein